MQYFYKVVLCLATICFWFSQVQASAESRKVEVTLGVQSPLLGTKGMEKFVIILPDSTSHEISISPGSVPTGGVGQRWRLGTINPDSFTKKDIDLYFTNVYRPENKTFHTTCSMKDIQRKSKEGKDLMKVRINVVPVAEKTYRCEFEEIFE